MHRVNIFWCHNNSKIFLNSHSLKHSSLTEVKKHNSNSLLNLPHLNNN